MLQFNVGVDDIVTVRTVVDENVDESGVIRQRVNRWVIVKRQDETE